MRQLTNYLARQFVTDALILFGVLCVLLWLVNCLRSFDVVSVQGQNLFTLAIQAALTMPPLIIAFFYICVGIGLARALQALQNNRELHIVHTSHGLGSLWRATAIVTGVGVVIVLLLANFVEPYANRRLNALNASIAADLVSSTLRPGRFTQVTPGVVLLIGGREGDGNIREFFADDQRQDGQRRTYIAETAQVYSDGSNYVIELRNGTLEYVESDGRFSEISFERYDISVEQLTQPIDRIDRLAQEDTVSLVRGALESGEWSERLVRVLNNRLSEGLRVIGITMFVLAVMGFPSGRRTRRGIPMEAVVLLVAFGERGVSAYSPLGQATGPLLLIVATGLTLMWRTRKRRIPMLAAS